MTSVYNDGCKSQTKRLEFLSSFGPAEESMMRLVSGNVAYELGKTI
jgi:hypothetical protein